MKKYIFLGLLGLLIMAFSATVYGQIEFKGSGFLADGMTWERNVPVLYGNVSSNFGAPAPYWVLNNGPTAPGGVSGDWNRDNFFMGTGGNIRFDAATGKSITGTIVFEWAGAYAGQNFANGYPTDNNTNANSAGILSADYNGILLKNAYIDFAVPQTPMNIRAGIQTFVVRPPFLIISDGTGISAAIKVDPVMIFPMWERLYQGNFGTSNTSDMFGGQVMAHVGDITVGGYAIDYAMKTYPLPENYLSPEYGQASSPNSANIWWLGLFADGKAGPVNFNFDFSLDTGKVKPKDNVGLPAGTPDVKYLGWVVQAKGDYPMDKFNFGGLFLYSTGADMNKTDTLGYAGNVVGTGIAPYSAMATKVGAFMTPPGSKAFAPWAESMFLAGNFSTLIGIPLGYFSAYTMFYNMVRAPYSGTWIAKLYASYKVTPWEKVTLQGLYIGDTTKHGNTLGNAVNSDGTLRDDKTIGWELALLSNTEIYKNLHLTSGIGILLPGKAMHQRVMDTSGPPFVYLNENAKPKAPLIFSTALAYFF